jgi:hypothetical protein
MNLTEKKKIEALVKRRADKVRARLQDRLREAAANINDEIELNTKQQKALDGLNAVEQEFKKLEAKRTVALNKARASLGIRPGEQCNYKTGVCLDVTREIGAKDKRWIAWNKHYREVIRAIQNGWGIDLKYDEVPQEVSDIIAKISAITDWTADQCQIAIWLGDDETAKELVASLNQQLEDMAS